MTDGYFNKCLIILGEQESKQVNNLLVDTYNIKLSIQKILIIIKISVNLLFPLQECESIDLI